MVELLHIQLVGLYLAKLSLTNVAYLGVFLYKVCSCSGTTFIQELAMMLQTRSMQLPKGTCSHPTAQEKAE